MKISFDLDGVLCRSPELALAHVLYRAHIVKVAELRRIYLSLLPRFQPQQFLAAGDEPSIITGRARIADAWSDIWLIEHGLGYMPRYFVATPKVNELWLAGKVEEATLETARLKAEKCSALHIDLHLDNNPTIVREMRRLGVPSLLVR